MQTRLSVTAILAGVLGTGLWFGLRSGTHLDVGTTAALMGILVGLVSALGVAWAQAPSHSTGMLKHPRRPDTGSLKAAKRSFADRHNELKTIKVMVRAARTRKGTRASIIIYGMPGAGKSEFAVHAAHKLATKFYRHARRTRLKMEVRQVDLHGLEGVARTDPKDALRGLLAESTNPELSKMSLDQLSGEWRKYLHDKFLILLLDNVDDEDQVLPFLPGGSSFILLATGRRVPLGLLTNGITTYHLDVLDKSGARQMIQNIVNRPIQQSDQAAIEGIARLCGYHPKAINLAVSSLAKDSRVSFEDRLDELKQAPSLLPVIDKYASKEYEGMAKSFERSYAHLQDTEKLVLRRLGLAPIPVLHPEAAAALANISVEAVAHSLDELAEEALIEAVDGGGGYQMHDLVRHYARLLSASDGLAENEAAVTRLLAYYHDAASHSDGMLTRQPPPRAIEPPAPTVRHEFLDRPSTIAWTRTELPNLLACADYVIQAAKDPDHRQEKGWVVLFATALAGFLRNEGMWRRSIELQSQAVEAAQQLGDPLAEANALTERGILRRLVTELDAAVNDLERAITLYRNVGGEQGRIGESNALNTYGVILDQLHRREEGKQDLAVALEICRALNYQLGEANILHDQGMAELFANNLDSAIQLISQALTLYRAIDQPLGMAHAHSNLARAHQEAGHPGEAAPHLESARALYRELGNQLGEINVLIRLGVALRQRDRRRAISILNDAVRLSIEIRNPLGHVNALIELGEVYLANRDQKKAKSFWTRALGVAQEHGITREEERAREKIGRLGLAETLMTGRHQCRPRTVGPAWELK